MSVKQLLIVLVVAIGFNVPGGNTVGTQPPSILIWDMNQQLSTINSFDAVSLQTSADEGAYLTSMSFTGSVLFYGGMFHDPTYGTNLGYVIVNRTPLFGSGFANFQYGFELLTILAYKEGVNLNVCILPFCSLSLRDIRWRRFWWNRIYLFVSTNCSIHHCRCQQSVCGNYLAFSYADFGFIVGDFQTIGVYFMDIEGVVSIV